MKTVTIPVSKFVSKVATTSLLVNAAVMASQFLIACHSKQKATEEIPPIGYFATREQARAAADRANADLAKSRVAEKSAGVRDQDLPCGQYKVISRNDSDGHPWWTTQRDMTGCPNPAIAPIPQSHTTGGQPR
jgi:hypothetical protein